MTQGKTYAIHERKPNNLIEQTISFRSEENLKLSIHAKVTTDKIFKRDVIQKHTIENDERKSRLCSYIKANGSPRKR